MPAVLAVLAWTLLLSCGDDPAGPRPPLDVPVPNSVSVSPASAALLALGDTVRFVAEVRDTNRRTITGIAVRWESSDARIVTVNTAGLASAVSNGEATISAWAGSVGPGTASIAVSQVPVAVSVSPPEASIETGDTLRLVVEALDANGHAIAETEFAWASSDTSVATVDTSGLVTAVRAGEAVIMASSGDETGRMELVVSAPVPATVNVTPSTLSFEALGDTARLSARVLDNRGRVIASAAVSWTSADPSVATADQAGLVTAVARGTTTVTARSGQASGSAVVSITQVADTVVVSPAAAALAPGDTLRLVAEAVDANGRALPEMEFAWSSSDPAVATVDATGLVRASVHQGLVAIFAQAGSVRGSAGITVGNADREVLRSFYEATDGPNWVRNDNWLTDAPLADWAGVRTDAEGRVSALVLEGNNISGPIPPELGTLAGLGRLRLRINRLTGPIPPELGNLAKLEEVNLEINHLTGVIPAEFGNLTNLWDLGLSRNQLEGGIPPELGELGKLEGLFLGSTGLTGPIPAELGDLSQLLALELQGNRFTGTIPAELGELAELELLWLHHNQLTGHLPWSFLQLVNLESFRFNHNDGLCAPGTDVFVRWVSRTTGGGSFCSESDQTILTTLFEAVGGVDWTRSTGWLAGAPLGEWYGVGTDSLGHVVTLDLSGNGLVGQLPSALGNLGRLSELRIGQNRLSGALPRSLARLPLRELRYADTGLCAPAEASFQSWLNAIPEYEGTGETCGTLSDRDILEALYDATGGPQWTQRRNWKTEAPLGQWHGVKVDSAGHVVQLLLDWNNLIGVIPAQLGALSRLERIRLAENNLTGAIPEEFGDLTSLRELDLSNNRLIGSIPKQLGNLADIGELVLGGNSLTGTIPLELTSLANLERLNLADNGLTGTIPPELGRLVNLVSLDLWQNNLTGPVPRELAGLAHLQELHLSNNPLSGTIPPELGDLANLTRLVLRRNRLTGPIPPELGNLHKLETLDIRDNYLSGTIPPILGTLTNLKHLSLDRNRFSGTIPSELGDLANLENIELSYNLLTGPIPAELGRLADMSLLELSRNQLTGPIPPEIGNLTALIWMHLGGNDLTGLIPAALGDLSRLEHLRLENNDLTGTIPPELGRLTSLEELVLSGNSGLSGAVPSSFTMLAALETFAVDGTDICAPLNDDFRAWLQGVTAQRVPPCIDRLEAFAYLIQAVQSWRFPVPLVADEPALLRVFMTATRSTSAGIPAVRATFYENDAEVHVTEIPAKTTAIPTDVDEGDLATSANAEIPASVIRPGLEMVVEIDPEGTLSEDLGVTKRIPETGRLTLAVSELPVLDLTLVPFLWRTEPDSAIIGTIRAMAQDPEGHELLRDTHTLLPVRTLAVTAHEPVISNSNDAYALLNEIRVLRTLEGGTGHYMGMLSGARSSTVVRGVAYSPGRESIAIADASVIAHELGHNMSLQHAPCGGAFYVDPFYPDPDGTTAAWGYDFRGRVLVPPNRADLMGYCDPYWISEYHFSKAARFRLADAAAAVAASTVADAAGRAARSILVWGGVDAAGQPFLEPAFVVDAPSVLPEPDGGDFEISGRTSAGDVLFSRRFSMRAIADGEGRFSFAFALPAPAGWAHELASIALSGPGGTATLDGDTNRPMVILRDPRSRQVRAFLRDLPPAALAGGRVAVDALTPEPGLEALFSRGLPDPGSWR